MAKPNDKQPNATRAFALPRSNDDLANPMPSVVLSSLPNPDDLKKLEKILPGTADRVLSMMERAQAEDINNKRWARWASFFSGIESFILKIFAAITGFVLKIFGVLASFILKVVSSTSDTFKTLSKESARLLVRVFAFILALATLAVPVYIALEAKSDINNWVEIAISIAVALGGALAGRSIYLKIGKLRLSSEKKSAGSSKAGASNESSSKK